MLAGCAASAQAETYPDRPIRLIVSIAAGSVTDVIMRTAAVELTPLLGGQPLIIENRGGASGIVAAQACAQAAPDGYTLCVIYHSTMSYNPLLFDHLPYDPDRDLVPVARLFFLNEGLFVSTELGVNSVAELKAMALTKSDQLNYATLGEGSYPDLFLRWMNNQWGTKIVGVPYKGGGPAAQALAGNQVQLTRFGIGNFLGLVKAGKVKALAVSADETLVAAAGRADARRSRPRRFSRPRLVGAGGAERHAAGDRQQGQCRLRQSVQRPEIHGVPGPAGGGAGADLAGRLRRLPEGGPQGGRGTGQDREHQARGVQAAIRCRLRRNI